MSINPSASLSAAVSQVLRPPMGVVRGTNSSLAFRKVATRDNFMTFDQATVDSTGVFLIGELERLDQKLHMPLAAVTWTRDIDLREDVTMADEVSSFTNSNFSAAQGIAGSNKSWAGKDSTAIPGIDLDIGKTGQRLEIWARQLSWTLPELASAQKLGRPVDEQKFAMMQMKYQMDIDEQVYVGDTVLGMNGMFNHASLTNTGNAVNGSWATATPAQILADINSLLTSVWATTGYSRVPEELRLDPLSFSILVSTLISTAGNISVLEFVRANSLSNAVNGRPVNIQPVKWLTGTNNSGRGPTATNSMFAYIKDSTLIRFPLVPLQRTPLEYRGINQLVTYFGRLGAVELVYSDTAGRRSNLG